MSWGILQIFGYKSLGEGDEQTGGFCGGNVGGWCYLWSIDVGRADPALHNDGPADNNEGMW